jgi:hypothetical protein
LTCNNERISGSSVVSHNCSGSCAGSGTPWRWRRCRASATRSVGILYIRDWRRSPKRSAKSFHRNTKPSSCQIPMWDGADG